MHTMRTDPFHHFVAVDADNKCVGIVAVSEMEKGRISAVNNWTLHTPAEKPELFRKVASVHCSIAQNLPKGT